MDSLKDWIIPLAGLVVTLLPLAVGGLVWLIRLESSSRHNGDRVRTIEARLEEGSRERRQSDEAIRQELADLRTIVARIEGKLDAQQGNGYKRES